jgi:hypothetical protein
MSTLPRYNVDMVNIRTELSRLWVASAPLTATAILMLVALAGFSVGLVLDDRIITGVPAWLKPAKFAASTAIYSATMAWLFRYIAVWPGFMRATGWTVAVVFIIEVAIIALQAARGTTSHFNAATSFDAAMFGAMGVCIGILWLASIGVLAALFRQKFENRAWGWWLRMGLLTTVIGSAAGGLMLRPTPEQIEMLQTTQSLTASGGHTVGGPDGGPGLAGTGWSTRHGDLRIPHFFGLHGFQMLPFLGWLALRGRRGQVRSQTGFAFTAAASYLAFMAILTWQALRGQSIVAPDAATLIALTAWLLGTAAAIVYFQFPKTLSMPFLQPQRGEG